MNSFTGLFISFTHAIPLIYHQTCEKAGKLKLRRSPIAILTALPAHFIVDLYQISTFNHSPSPKSVRKKGHGIYETFLLSFQLQSTEATFLHVLRP